jgi:hypothetical protein
MYKRQLQFLLLFGAITGLVLVSLEGRTKGISYSAGYFLYALNFLAINKIGAILVQRQRQKDAKKGSNLGLVLLLFGKIALLAGSLYLALIYFDLNKLLFAGGALIALIISSVSVYLGYQNTQANEKST